MAGISTKPLKHTILELVAHNLLTLPMHSRLQLARQGMLIRRLT